MTQNYTDFYWEKRGFIYKPDDVTSWWCSNAHAPTPILYNKDTIRIYVGAWDKNGISRISYIDVDACNPSNILNVSQTILLDIGDDGCFDDNGVFPAHAYKLGNRVYLYYTGFQKLDKISFSNFSGLAISEDGGDTFKRVSRAPVIDRADEGLFTRAGLSAIFEDGVFKCCYSVGSGWYNIAGKDRPIYDVNYIESKNGIDFGKTGEKIIPVDLSKEHGLGRPQIVKLLGQTYCFYTRRTLDFKYYIGVARLIEDGAWERIDHWVETIKHGRIGEFDEKMIYFPAVIDTGCRTFLFYTGNGYGREGIGYAELLKMPSAPQEKVKDTPHSLEE